MGLCDVAFRFVEALFFLSDFNRVLALVCLESISFIAKNSLLLGDNFPFFIKFYSECVVVFVFEVHDFLVVLKFYSQLSCVSFVLCLKVNLFYTRRTTSIHDKKNHTE